MTYGSSSNAITHLEWHSRLFHQLQAFLTSGESNLTYGRIGAAPGRFTSIHQVVPMWPYLIHASNNPPETKTQTTPPSVQPFLDSSQQRVLILYNRQCLSPLKIAFSHGRDNIVPWVCPSPQPKQHLDWLIHFCRAHDCDGQTDRQTDRTRYSISNNRPHVCSTAMQPKNEQVVKEFWWEAALQGSMGKFKFSFGKFNVILDCFCGQPMGMQFNSM